MLRAAAAGRRPAAPTVGAMDPNLLIAVGCIGLSILIIVMVAAVGRRMTLRAALWWIGLACLPIAALILGMIPYLIDAWNMLFATTAMAPSQPTSWWASLQQPFTPVVTAGLVVGGIGLALLFGSRLVPYRKRERRPKAVAPDAGAPTLRSRPDYSSGGASVAPTATSTATPTDTTP